MLVKTPHDFVAADANCLSRMSVYAPRNFILAPRPAGFFLRIYTKLIMGFEPGRAEDAGGTFCVELAIKSLDSGAEAADANCLSRMSVYAPRNFILAPRPAGFFLLIKKRGLFKHYQIFK
jgi:hypothetical protein